MNIFLRQNIVGLLRHAAESFPSLREQALAAAAELKFGESVAWLEAASWVFQEAVVLSGDPVYVTGTYWAEHALGEVSPAERSAPAAADTREPREEAIAGWLELLERCRRGASLEQALALFPHWGDEWAPVDGDREDPDLLRGSVSHGG